MESTSKNSNKGQTGDRHASSVISFRKHSITSGANQGNVRQCPTQINFVKFTGSLPMRAKRQDTKDANKPQHSQHCCAAPCRGVMNHVKDFRMSHDTTQLPPHTMSLWQPGVSTSSELAALLASKTNIFQIKWHLKRTTICIASYRLIFPGAACTQKFSWKAEGQLLPGQSHLRAVGHTWPIPVKGVSRTD